MCIIGVVEHVRAKPVSAWFVLVPVGVVHRRPVRPLPAVTAQWVVQAESNP